MGYKRLGPLVGPLLCWITIVAVSLGTLTLWTGLAVSAECGGGINTDILNPKPMETLSGTVDVRAKISCAGKIKAVTMTAGNTAVAHEHFYPDEMPTLYTMEMEWHTIGEPDGVYEISVNVVNGDNTDCSQHAGFWEVKNDNPGITVESPSDEIVTDFDDNIDVIAAISKGTGSKIDHLSLYLNSTALDICEYDPAVSSVDYDYDIRPGDLDDGSNTLEIMARNADGKTSTRVVHLYKFHKVDCTWYFANGSTSMTVGGAEFLTYLCLGNPCEKKSRVVVKYMLGHTNTTPLIRYYEVEPESRTTVSIIEEVGWGEEFAIEIYADQYMVAERPMYFCNIGGYEDWSGGTDTVGVYEPSKAFYFAEGTTRPGFSTNLYLYNPNDSKAQVTIEYMIENEGLQLKSLEMGTRSRTEVSVVDHIGPDKDVSVKVSSDKSILAERSMYFRYRGLIDRGTTWNGGHSVVGLADPTFVYFFAEGATYHNFEEWLCLQNPHDKPLEVTATYMLTGGENIEKDYTVPANQRKTISVNLEAGWDEDVSVQLWGSDIFVAERSMYFDYSGMKGYSYTGGHDVIGSSSISCVFFFAEGFTGGRFDDWLCLQNPNPMPVTVEVIYYIEGGGTKTTTHSLLPMSRYTIYVNQDAGEDLALSAMVLCEVGILAERPMYFGFYDRNGGTDVMGFNPNAPI